MRELQAELLGGPSCELGEGPVWHAGGRAGEGELAWVDIPGQTIHRAALGTDATLGEVRVTDVGGDLGAVVPVASGGWLLARAQGFAHLADDGTITALVQPEGGSGGANRMNDAKCDARGRWFAGSMAYDNAKGAGALYRVDLDGSVSKILAGTTISNGLGFSADDTTFFFNDSGEQTFSRYTFDADAGTISDQQVLVRGESDTMPDGLTVDDEGCVWTAWYDGGAVRRYSPAGEHLATVHVPVKRTSSCTFAGPDRDLLVISTGRADDDPSPEKGRLFCCRPGVTGPASVPFAGSLPH